MYEKTWKSKRRQFQLMSRCMTSMIERLIPSNLKTRGFWKIIIECVDTKNRPIGIYLPGILFVQVLFDGDGFFDLDNCEKKAYIIDKVMEATECLTDNGFDEVEILKSICDEIIRLDYVNEWFYGKFYYNCDKSVGIKVSHEVDKARIYMVFKDKEKRVLKERLLVETEPDEWAYCKYLGKLKWISEYAAQLVTKSGDVFIESMQ